jgi:hypothetical protein
MHEFCDNPYCENPGTKEVPVSVEKASDQKRTLCAPCHEAYSWGVQHGTMTAQQAVKFGSPNPRVDERELATILAALRFHQDENLQGGAGIADEAIKAIASDGGRLRPLTFDEVARLCERINVRGHPTDRKACRHPALQRIHDLLYLDMKDGQESHNPDKEWDTDVLTMIAEVVAEYIPRPR